MFKFFENIKKKNQGKDSYNSILLNCLKSGNITDEDKSRLNEILTNFELSKNKVIGYEKSFSRQLYSNFTKNKRFSESDKNIFDGVISYFGFGLKDLNIQESDITKFQILSLIDNGTLPHFNNPEIGIIFKNNEILHWICKASLKKFKKVTSTGGYVGSLKITKSLRYRSYTPVYSNTHTEIVIEDSGFFWISNQRLGFKGSTKNFTIALDKLLSIEHTQNGFYISKEGREAPYILSLDDYDIPDALFSIILNDSNA